MAAAGSAVGLGNIWKFPYVTGENGGGAFLLIYLACILALGVPLIMAELAVGRGARRNPVGAFRALAGGAWPLVGMLGIFTGFIILSFYIVVAGWTLAYVVFTASGQLTSTDPQALGQAFGGFISGSYLPIGCAALFMIATAGVVIGGISNGIERVSKLLMPLLFVLLIVLVFRVITLPGAAQGLNFYLLPDWSRVSADTFTAAIGQAFFSLSLGMGALLTYGSYLHEQQHLPRSSLSVAGLDTGIAILAGFMILPAVFAFGFNPESGPKLAFITLPAVFASMPAGVIFGVIFFLLLTVAALTSAVSLLEVVVTYLIDEWYLTRRRATIIAALVCFAVGIPSALSQGASEAFVINGVPFLDWMVKLTDFLLPLGGMLTALCVGWIIGPRAVTLAQGEANSFPLATAWLWMLRLTVPAGIFWILKNDLLALAVWLIALL